MAERVLTRNEELVNGATHGLALAASVAVLPSLVASAGRHDTVQMAGAAVFGGTLILVYAASTIYHLLPHSPAKRWFRVLDHVAIYLLIAGTYTPFTLGALRGTWGASMLGAIWGLAVAGILAKLTLGFRFPHLSTAFYVGMGWMAVFAAGPVVEHVDKVGIAWLVAGGLSYTGGVVFFAWESLPFGHAIWHLFVAAGSLCHVCAVLWHAAGRVG